MTTWTDHGIDIRGKTSGQISTTCPQCSASRKKKHVTCLSVNLDECVWNCHHCDWSGSLQRGEDRRANPAAPPVIFRKPVYQETTLPRKVVDWFHGRGIPEKVLGRRRISYGDIYMPQAEDFVTAIQFPYFRSGEVCNVKYRDGHKFFRMVGGAERMLYGLDDIQGDTLYITEGEIDTMSLEVAGYHSVVSVPDGAPPVNAKNYERKFDFLLSAEETLAPLTKIVLAVDTDGPGQKLAEELARRLGPQRCFQVVWPDGCKDANDVLVQHGVLEVRRCVERARPWPVAGIVSVSQLVQKVTHMYHYGIERGVSTGWPTLNPHYNVRIGELSIVSGIPSHGKTSWLAALIINLAQHHDWRCTFFSPENQPLEQYMASLLELYIGKPFDGAPGRMSAPDIHAGMAWLDEHISFLLPEDGDVPTLERLLELAAIQVYRHGIKGFILDPWNEIEHHRPAGQTETEYVSRALSRIRQFTKHHGVHVWVIAHPTKLHKAEKGKYEGQYPPPTPYDVSGSSHFRNKADNCLTIWRDVDADDGLVEVHVQKVRFKVIGKPGMVPLVYEQDCGRFHEPRLEDQAWSA